MLSTGQKLYAQLKEIDFECQAMRDNGFNWNFTEAARLEKEWTEKQTIALNHLRKAVYSLGPSKWFGAYRVSAWELDHAEYTKGNPAKGKPPRFKHLGSFNPGSPDDVKELFFSWKWGFKLAPVRWTPEGEPSTDENAITAYLKSDNQAVVTFCHELFDYREAAKVLGTYVIGCKPAEGKTTVHGIWKSYGTVGGRLSCVEVPLQTTPEQLRCLFIAADGMEICETDWSQLEIRTLAIQANAKAMRDTFDREGDIYLETARRMFGIQGLVRKEHDSDTNPFAIQGERLRQLTKVVALSSHYMASDESVWRTIIKGVMSSKDGDFKDKYRNLRVKDVCKLKLAYFKVHHEIPVWWGKIIAEAHKLSYYLEEVSGRLIHFYGDPDGAFLANFKNQSLGAHLMNESFLKVCAEFRARGLGEHVKTQIHDSLCSQGPSGKDLKMVQEKHMVKTLYFKDREIFLPVKSKIAVSYADVK